MKNKKIIVIVATMVALTIFGNGYAKFEKTPFPNMPPEIQSNLYYFLSVVEYKVEQVNPTQKNDEKKAKITVKLTGNQASVMTDRPYRKTVSTTVENFIHYIQRQEKKDLNLTLMIHGKDDTYTPMSFEQNGVTYNAQDKTMTFQATLVDSTATQQWIKHPEMTTIQGRYTTLMAEG
ncbi:MAG: hypothetical protein ABFQ95_00310 [Pseudomonadota bacterium]